MSTENPGEEAGTMLLFRRKKLVGSYFAVISARGRMFSG